ncbi:MAG TPA: methyl-accepting chemotaxis protein, partial [Rubrivivax sp.]|nr:methyl-accepting chemotaxis protein [Rubrivivax sp.]
QRSAEAAKEIKGLITASVERVGQGTTLVDEAGATMKEVVGAIRRVTEIMSEISTASTEQSQGVAQVGEAVSQMDQVTQQNAALVEESAAAAESLRHQATQLVSAVSVFKLGRGATAIAAAPVAASAVTRAPAVPTERRSPARATNVTRPSFGKAKPAKAPAKAAAEPVPAEPAAAASRTGTDNWESF